MSRDQKVPSRIVIIDGTNALYRAFFAIPGLRAPDGSPTNAAYGFITMLGKVIREEQADAVIVVFDARGKTFRHALYADYKAGREAQPEDLSAQIPLVHELVEAHRIPILEVPQFEADDVIATLVARAPKNARVFIVSTDKDLMQLVDENVMLLDGMKDRRYDPAAVEERFGVPPDKILDVRALIGDPSDNIPGVRGIGAKGAAQLIAEWGDLENLLEHVDEVKAKRARNALGEHAEDARLSKQLSTLRTDVPLPLEFSDAVLTSPDVDRLRELYQRLGFTRLLDALEGAAAAGAEGVSPDVDVTVVTNQAGLDAVLEELAKLPNATLLPVLDEAGPLAGSAVGLAIALAGGRAAYLPLGEDALTLAEVASRLEPLLGARGSVAWA
ncbi:MAG: DNA polymerase I, partial [Myxococcales bacterium]|nr:DNA polymerase I [Myxococcales bacterium]